MMMILLQCCVWLGWVDLLQLAGKWRAKISLAKDDFVKEMFAATPESKQQILTKHVQNVKR